MKLFGHPESGHAFKVRFFFRHAGIEHDYEVVDIFAPREQRPAEFRENARYGEVPLLLDGGRAIAQSNAILMHVAESRGGHGAGDTACREWLFWEGYKIGLCLPQLRSYRRFDDHGISADAHAWLTARYDRDIAVMDEALSDGRDWIAGSARPSIADFSLCGYLMHADEAQVVIPRHVERWLERLRALPAWQEPYAMLAAD